MINRDRSEWALAVAEPCIRSSKSRIMDATSSGTKIRRFVEFVQRRLDQEFEFQESRTIVYRIYDGKWFYIFYRCSSLSLSNYGRSIGSILSRVKCQQESRVTVPGEA